jgi:hypothetical protein
MKTLYITLVLLIGGATLFAQETTNPKEDPKPKEQPLDKPVVEDPKARPTEELKPDPKAALNANTAIQSGQSPSASPEAAFNSRVQDIPVNLFTGTPMINFPIYTLSEPGGVSVPISLSYNASGM